MIERLKNGKSLHFVNSRIPVTREQAEVGLIWPHGEGVMVDES